MNLFTVCTAFVSALEHSILPVEKYPIASLAHLFEFGRTNFVVLSIICVALSVTFIVAMCLHGGGTSTSNSGESPAASSDTDDEISALEKQVTPREGTYGSEKHVPAIDVATHRQTSPRGLGPPHSPRVGDFPDDISPGPDAEDAQESSG